MVHVSDGTGPPRRPAKTQASKDIDAVNNIKTLLVSGLINPFISSSSDLLNIATGEKCVSLDLLEAKEKGQEALSRAEETLNATVTPVRLLLRYICYSGTSADFPREATETSRIIENKYIPER